MNVRDNQQARQIGRFEVYCLKTETIEKRYTKYTSEDGSEQIATEVTTSGLRDWSAVPAATLAKVEAHIRERRLTWIWEAEFDGWEFQGQDREEKRIMNEIRDCYEILAPLSMERKRKLWYHGMRALIEDVPMPKVWSDLQARRAVPSTVTEARIAALEARLAAIRG